MRYHTGRCCRLLLLALACAVGGRIPAEDRTLDGTGNHPNESAWGAANTPFVRISYPSSYPGNGLGGSMLTDAQRINPRTVSNALSAQEGSIPSARGLSTFIGLWGQFLDHDLSLTTSSAGAAVNGTADIPVLDASDPLGPNPIQFTRSNFVTGNGIGPVRQQLNEVSSFLDASQVYGPSALRAAALRSEMGSGARLQMSPGNLLPFNTMGLPNMNQGTLPDASLFLTGDIRANDNLGLLALHTIFAREHNRLVDLIAAQQPELTAEQQYQLARKIVGAELQIVTYREFLPALMGPDQAPRDSDYQYDDQLRPDITQSFAHSAFRFGHSAISPTLSLVNNLGQDQAELPVSETFFRPTVLANDPQALDWLLKGAATQVSQEIDTKLIGDLRSFPFGAPGDGGLDLASLDIQRGRDHGLPDYNFLRLSYELPTYATFQQITSDPQLAQLLSDLYSGDLSNVDSWIAGLAEDHVPGSSLGPLFQSILGAQFVRLRDGDRLFYSSDAAGLYQNGTLRPEIAELIDLNRISLSQILRWNSSLTNVQDNVFYAMRFVRSGDFDANGHLDCLDVDALTLQISTGTYSTEFDLTQDGLVNRDDLAAWLTEAGSLQLSSGRPYAYGDANLDGQVDGGDFGLWNASKFTSTARWCNGDFNADGVVDGSDFGIWNQAKFQSAASQVPEPIGCLFFLGIMYWLRDTARMAGMDSPYALRTSRSNAPGRVPG